MEPSSYCVSRMTESEVRTSISWAARAGWNPGLHDASCFYQADPNGFFAGKLHGKIISVGSAVAYDDHFAFCGLYIVDKDYRGQGYGMALTRERLNYIGQRNAGIDGVTDMLDKYAQLGYRIAHNNARYEGQHISTRPKKNAAIVPLNKINFDTLCDYDRRHFPAPRRAFLKCWINQPGATCLGYVHKGKLLGYGVLRPCLAGFKIGPLFADNADIAHSLSSSLISNTNGDLFYLDIIDNHQQAVELVRQFGMQKVFETARMYLKGQPDIEYEHIYGITTFELG